MNFGGDDYEYEPEELDSIHKRFKHGDRISNKDIAISKNVHPVICYNLIDTTSSKYGFGQQCFDGKDAKLYFQRIKEISTSTIQDLISTGKREWHLKPSGKGCEIINALKTLYNARYIDDDHPDIYHFALYTDENKANRAQQIKSPRIHFLVGAHGMLYILFYDPYHEINP